MTNRPTPEPECDPLKGSRNPCPRCNPDPEYASIKAEADAAMAEYPQYAGHYDDYKLIEIVSLRGFRRRARDQWTVGDITIGKLNHDTSPHGLGTYISAWNRKTLVNCAIGTDNARFI